MSCTRLKEWPKSVRPEDQDRPSGDADGSGPAGEAAASGKKKGGRKGRSSE